MTFQIALSNVILTLLYILPGFLVCKFKKASAAHLSSMSGILIYVCSPCMVLSCFLPLEFSWEHLRGMGLMFIITLALQCLFVALIYLIIRKKSHEAKYRLLTVACTLGNVGFFGLPVIRALFPENPEVLCYNVVNMITMNILIFTMGVFCLTGKKEYMSLRAAVCNPAIASFSVGFLVYVLGLGKYVPELVTGGIDLVGKMTAPLCMIILGIRLATVPFKSLFATPMVYLVCLGKLIAFPLFCFAILHFLPLDPLIKATALILSATPGASVVFNLAEIYDSEADLSANCVLLTTLLCFLTIPLVTFLI